MGRPEKKYVNLYGRLEYMMPLVTAITNTMYMTYLCTIISQSGRSILTYICNNSRRDIYVQVEVSRFEDLEESHAEVKLKETLWLTQKEWEADAEKWMHVSCCMHVDA